MKDPLARNFLTSPDIRIPVVGIVPVDLELVVVPVRVRDIAVRIARTALLPFSFLPSPNIFFKIFCVPLGVLQALYRKR